MRKLFALAVLLLLGALTAACGGDDSSTSSAPTTVAAGSATTNADAADHNDADVTFAKEMIEHHAQAVEMADMAIDKSKNEQLLDMAERIKAAQQPEIDQMTGWLEAWGEAGDTATTMGGHDMGSMGSSGGEATGTMMTDAEMSELEAATGTEFDQMWLDMMIRHHQGAIDMAKTHQSEGQNPDALALGQSIIDAQQAEITEMQGIAA